MGYKIHLEKKMAYTLEIKRWKKQLDKINCIAMFQS